MYEEGRRKELSTKLIRIFSKMFLRRKCVFFSSWLPNRMAGKLAGVLLFFYFFFFFVILSGGGRTGFSFGRLHSEIMVINAHLCCLF